MNERYVLEKLARITRSARCLEYDACPGPSGLLYSIDGYSTRDSMLPWMTYRDWGWKAVVAAASDVAASGGRPLAIMYSVGVSSREDAYEVAAGVAEAAEWLGVEVLKSDTNRTPGDGWIDVAVVGESPRPVPRSAARPGDLLVQIGPVGYGAIARLALEGMLKIDDVGKARIYTARPKPPIIMGYWIAACRASASSDNSDGWAYTLENIAVSSGVDIHVSDILADRYIIEALDNAGVSVVEELMASWEDYNMAVAVAREKAACILDECRKHGVTCGIVGEVRSGRGYVYFRGRRVKVRHWSWLS